MLSMERKNPDIVRKIDLMHRLFGKCEREKCADCSHLYRRDYGGTYYKCEIYGNSHAATTDWRLKYDACGLFNKKYEGKDVVKLVGRTASIIYCDEPLEGQLAFEWDEQEAE